MTKDGPAPLVSPHVIRDPRYRPGGFAALGLNQGICRKGGNDQSKKDNQGIMDVSPIMLWWQPQSSHSGIRGEEWND
jgi:hypothetical protein